MRLSLFRSLVCAVQRDPTVQVGLGPAVVSEYELGRLVVFLNRNASEFSAKEHGWILSMKVSEKERKDGLQKA